MNSKISDRRGRWWITALIASVGVFGCEAEDVSLLQPTVSEARYGQKKTLSVPVPTDAMTIAIQDEYRAQATYAKVLVDLGSVKPFSNIVVAEARHVEAIARLFTVNGLEVPASEWNEGNVPVFSTLAEACAAAAEGELANAALYNDFLLLTLPINVRKVFERLRDASLLRHLAAFQRCM